MQVCDVETPRRIPQETYDRNKAGYDMTRRETEKFILDHIDGFEIVIKIDWPEGDKIRRMRYTNQRALPSSLKVEAIDFKDGIEIRKSDHYVSIDHMIDDLLGPRITKASQYLGRLLISNKLDII
jgi:hypothetical protein